MFAAEKPFDAALAHKMLCYASPFAVRAVYGSESVFDYKLLMLDVNLVVTAFADEVSGIELLRFGGVCSDGRVHTARCTVLAIPFDGHFVVQLRGSDFDGVEHPLFTVPLDGVVRRACLDHSLHLLSWCGGPLSDDGMFNRLVAELVGRSIKYSFDGGHAGAEAKVP